MHLNVQSSIIGILLFAGIAVSCESAPAGGQSSTNDSSAASVDTSEYLRRGQEISTAAFTALSGELKAALQRGGVPEAVNYCNLTAQPLVDSLSEVYAARVRRVSDRYRNPVDAPTDTERQILQAYQSELAAGTNPEPTIQTLPNGDIGWYAPIMTNSLCLQCHGIPGETISEEHYQLIRERYPEDKATGYGEGEFRGIWSITFSGEQE